jgi:hypothetical protein
MTLRLILGERSSLPHLPSAALPDHFREDRSRRSGGAAGPHKARARALRRHVGQKCVFAELVATGKEERVIDGLE